MCHVHVTVNSSISMNKRPLSASQLEETLAAKLRELLDQVEWLNKVEVQLTRGLSSGFDVLAKLPVAGGGKVALCVECKSELRPSQFRQFAERKLSPNGNYK